ncbi:MAG: hypothetical protein WCT05_14075 [Lentisphaeria bacterium]
MKFEKRSSGAPEQELPEEQKASGKKKPVVVYIMILFIVAFILMAISFVMHQRSNSEVIGKLQDSVTALQKVQSTQDENVRLQDDLKTAQDSCDQLQQELDAANTAAQASEDKATALYSLYLLQQEYAAGDFDACNQTISDMESNGLDKLLPADSQSVAAPAQRYLQLREAVK